MRDLKSWQHTIRQEVNAKTARGKNQHASADSITPQQSQEGSQNGLIGDKSDLTENHQVERYELHAIRIAQEENLDKEKYD